MATNQFEKVDSVQTDALTLELVARDGVQFGVIYCPAAASGGKLPKDYNSGPVPGQEAFRSAIKLANELRVPIVVLDEQNLWPEQWGELYFVED